MKAQLVKSVIFVSIVYLSCSNSWAGDEKTVTPHEAVAAFKAKGKTVVTFVGYSGAEYENKEGMAQIAKTELAKLDPKSTVINIGSTPEGIGAVYKIAKEMGFETTGIVSSKAKEYPSLSPFVDSTFYIVDSTWGGFGKDGKLNPTSLAMVQASDRMIGIGGGEVGRDEMLAARRAGKTVSFVPADMSHEVAIAKAKKKNDPAPTEFRGPAHLSLEPDVASVEQIQSHFKGTGKKVVTFIGYSGLGYEDPSAVLSKAHEIMEKLNPSTTIINIGGTTDGVGKVYELAKDMGFETTGIVSEKAKAYGGLSPYMDKGFYVADSTWGGYADGTKKLNPTSEAMVGVSDAVFAIGGGEIGLAELETAKERGKPTTFIPADMNHETATKKAAKGGKPAPDFRGPIHLAILGNGDSKTPSTNPSHLSLDQCLFKLLGK